MDIKIYHINGFEYEIMLERNGNEWRANLFLESDNEDCHFLDQGALGTQVLRIKDNYENGDIELSDNERNLVREFCSHLDTYDCILAYRFFGNAYDAYMKSLSDGSPLDERDNLMGMMRKYMHIIRDFRGGCPPVLSRYLHNLDLEFSAACMDGTLRSGDYVFKSKIR